MPAFPFYFLHICLSPLMKENKITIEKAEHWLPESFLQFSATLKRVIKESLWFKPQIPFLLPPTISFVVFHAGCVSVLQFYKHLFYYQIMSLFPSKMDYSICRMVGQMQHAETATVKKPIKHSYHRQHKQTYKGGNLESSTRWPARCLESQWEF